MADGAGGWSTIESDEGVFTSLIENLGVKDVQFEELISLDADTIRSLSPVYGVIFLFKYISSSANSTSTPLDGTFDPTATEPPSNLFFAAQTIQNACGTQAVLSVILNQEQQQQQQSSLPSPGDKSGITIGAELASFKDFTTGFPSDLRGEALSNSAAIRTAHNAFARASPFADETQRVATSSDDVYHFIAYTPVNGKLYELDGLQPHPISHGECSLDDFPEKIIPVLQRRIGRYPSGEIRFNLMAVVRDLRIRAQDFQDTEGMDRERKKRTAWAWENALRRWNFVGFIGETLKGVARMKTEEGAFENWVDEAKETTKKRIEMRKGRMDELQE